MNTSTEINEIAKALAAAQGEIKNPKKGSENPHFKSRYADLADGLEAVRVALSDNRLSIVQSTEIVGDVLVLETRLVHASGQWFASFWPVCRFPSTPQQMGSALTYARRYALFALVGIAGDDDDGNAASTAQTPAPKAVAKQGQDWSVTKDQQAYIDLFTHIIAEHDDINEFRALWANEADNRAMVGITEKHAAHGLLKSAWSQRGKELSAQQKEAA